MYFIGPALTLAAPKDHELAGLVSAVKVEPAQLGLAAAPVHRQLTDGFPRLQHACALNRFHLKHSIPSYFHNSDTFRKFSSAPPSKLILYTVQYVWFISFNL